MLMTVRNLRILMLVLLCLLMLGIVVISWELPIIPKADCAPIQASLEEPHVKQDDGGRLDLDQNGNGCDQIVVQPTQTPSSRAELAWAERWEISFPACPAWEADDIARIGFTLWLDQFQSVSTSPNIRLLQARVESLQLSIDPFFRDYYKAYEIHYAVLPAESNAPRWIAGDGRYGQDGWIEDKVHYIGFSMDEAFVRVFVLGPCPWC